MIQLSTNIQGEWTITSNEGGILSFTSFMGMEFIANARVNEEALEEGTFTSYNKSESSSEAHINLGLSYERGADIPATLRTLEDWKRRPVLLTIVTPEHVLENYSLEKFSYNRTSEDGVGVVFVDLVVREIREIGNTNLAGGGLSYSTVKNPSNASEVNRGTVGAKQDQSILAYLGF